MDGLIPRTQGGRFTTSRYTVVMTSPRSVRFEPDTLTKLTTYANKHPGLSTSSAAAMLVEEGLRMDAHPGVVFRDGPSGRRAGLIQGPDVWEVIAAVRDVRGAEPKLAAHDVVAAVSNLTGVSSVHVRIAVDYYSAYPTEIDADLDANEAAEVALREQIARSQDLLGA